MNEYNLLPDNEVTTVEDRVYLNPNLQTEQTNNFIDNLRLAQQSNNQQIQAQTQGLGIQVPSNLGGLTGGEGYWTSRYQTPQTNAATQNLRTAAQAAALNQALANEQAMWKKRYQEAYNAYQKRQNDKTNTTTPDNTKTPDNISTSDTTQEITNVETEALANSRYQKLLMKYLQAGYPIAEAEAKAKEDFSKSISIDAPVEPYGGQ